MVIAVIAELPEAAPYRLALLSVIASGKETPSSPFPCGVTAGQRLTGSVFHTKPMPGERIRIGNPRSPVADVRSRPTHIQRYRVTTDYLNSLG